MPRPTPSTSPEPSVLVPPERLLLGGQLAPFTHHVVFLEGPTPDVAAAFVRWRTQHGQTCEAVESRAGLSEALAALRPLSFEHRRHVFLPTASRWTAYVNNYPLGTNAHSVLPEFPLFVGCRAVLVSAVPAGADEEVLAWSVYGPAATDAQPVRSVGVRNARGWWRFWRTGPPLAFEDVTAYRSRRLRRRFTFERLVAYTAALDLRPFDASFYTPESSGAVVVRCGPHPSLP